MSDDFVLVTGASGYLGAHVVKVFLENGFRVRGTVRSLQNEEKVRPIRELAKNSKYPLELVEADLLDENSWKAAVQDCTLVAHVASPLPIDQPNNQDEVLRPAIDGTLNVLNACFNTNVRRVVVTSSGFSIFGSEYQDNKEYSTQDWGNTETNHAYCKSKILAERAAWNFVKDKQDKNEKVFELVVINPTSILGPVLHDSLGTSASIFVNLLKGRVEKVPDIYFPICDVRDVALAHLRALTVREAANKRFIVISENHFIPFIRCVVILNKAFGSKGYKISLDKEICKRSIGKTCSMNDKDTKEILQLNITNLESTIIDMANSLIERGFLDKY